MFSLMAEFRKRFSKRSLFISLFLLAFGVLFASEADAALCSGDVCNIVDDATGGECTLIGTWSVPTKTCVMTTDLTTDTVSIDSNGITFDGDSVSPHSITGAGLGGTSGVRSTAPLNVVVQNVVVDNFDFAISFFGVNSTSLIVQNCTLQNNLSGGISLNDDTDSQILDNTFINNGAGGVADGNSLRSVYMRNSFLTSSPGILFQNVAVASGDFVVSNNQFTLAAGEFGVTISSLNGTGNRIGGNNTFTGDGTAISYNGATNSPHALLVDSNTISTSSGVLISNSTNGPTDSLTISSNTMNYVGGSPGFGVSFSGSSGLDNVLITGNTISNQKGIDARGNSFGSNITISNNTITGTTAFQSMLFFGHSSGPTFAPGGMITGNTLIGAGLSDSGLLLTFAENVLVQNNTISGFANTGIFLLNARNNIFTSNTSSSNTLNGIRLVNADCSGNTFTSNTIDNNGSNGIQVSSGCTGTVINSNQVLGNGLDIRNDDAATSGDQNLCVTTGGSSGYKDTSAVAGCLYTVNVCGDGNLFGAEQCDDGNLDIGDGCDQLCQIEIPPVCGNSIIEMAEECDDGNTTDGDGCSSLCLAESSGRSINRRDSDVVVESSDLDTSSSSVSVSDGNPPLTTGTVDIPSIYLDDEELLLEQGQSFTDADGNFTGARRGSAQSSQSFTTQAGGIQGDSTFYDDEENLVDIHVSLPSALWLLYEWVTPVQHQFVNYSLRMRDRSYRSWTEKSVYTRLGDFMKTRDGIHIYRPVEKVEDLSQLTKMLMYGFSDCFSDEQLQYATQFAALSTENWWKGYWRAFQYLTPSRGLYLPWSSVFEIEVIPFVLRFLDQECPVYGVYSENS